MVEKSTKRLVFITAPNEAEARKIANSLVEENLAACVSIVPKIVSIYRWEGKVTEDEELLLIVKTSEEKFSALSESVVKLHSYKTPEIIAIAIADGLKSYLDWIDDSLGSSLTEKIPIRAPNKKIK